MLDRRLASANGTYVNDRRFEQAVLLRDRDEITIGSGRIIFRSPDTAHARRDDDARLDQTVHEVRQLTAWLLLVDVIDSSGIGQRLGPHAMAQTLSEWLGRCRETLDARGGILDKPLGDGFFAFWPTAERAPGEVADALMAFKQLQETPLLPFRMVVHRGAVFTGGQMASGIYRLFGPEVSFTFRMESLAKTLKIGCFLSEPAAGALGHHVSATLVGSHHLPGVGGPFSSSACSGPGPALAARARTAPARVSRDGSTTPSARDERMRLFDAVLNGYFVFLCLLFVTGGFVPRASAPHPRLLTEMNQLGPWVAGFLALVAWRRLGDRTGPLTGVGMARRLGALAERAAARSGALYLFTALWALLLVAVAIRRHLAFDDNGDLAIFDQAFWNTIHGAFLRSSLVPGVPGEVTIFADHFDPLSCCWSPSTSRSPRPSCSSWSRASCSPSAPFLSTGLRATVSPAIPRSPRSSPCSTSSTFRSAEPTAMTTTRPRWRRRSSSSRCTAWRRVDGSG